MPAYLVDFVAVVVIPFIVELLKKLKLPTKIAPIAAVALAAGYMVIAKWLGLPGAEFTSALSVIIKALGIGAVSVLGYDLMKLFKK